MAEKNFAEGNVLFDTLTVMGKEFITSPSTNTHYYDYSYSVTPSLSTKKRKKGEPELYDYV